MRFEMQSVMNSSPEELWRHLHDTRVFRQVAAPLMTFESMDHDGLPASWAEGKSYKLAMRAFGVVPLGHHTITFMAIDERSRAVKTRETGLLIRSWRHTMKIVVDSNDKTVFRDELDVQNGLLTWPTFAGAYLFFMYRHWKFKRLIDKGVLAADRD